MFLCPKKRTLGTADSKGEATCFLCFLSSLWETIKRFSARKTLSKHTELFSAHRLDRLNRLSHTLRLCWPPGCCFWTEEHKNRCFSLDRSIELRSPEMNGEITSHAVFEYPLRSDASLSALVPLT